MVTRRFFLSLSGGAIAAALCPQVEGRSSPQNMDNLVLPENTEVRIGGSRMIESTGAIVSGRKGR